MGLRQNQVHNICAIVEESKNKNKKISNSNKKKPTCIFLIVIGILHVNYAKKIKKGEKNNENIYTRLLIHQQFFVHLKSNKNNCKKNPQKYHQPVKNSAYCFYKKNKEALLWTTKKKQ